MTVCYNTKTAIQTVWSSGSTSDSVEFEWWSSLCDAKTGAYEALTVFSQGQPDFFGLKVEDPFKVGGMEVDNVKAHIVSSSPLVTV